MNVWDKLIQPLLDELMQNFELYLTIIVGICLVCYVIDGLTYRKTRKYLWRVFSQQKETDADRNIYSNRLLIAHKKRIPRKLKEVFTSAQLDLNHRRPLSGKQLYWIRRPVHTAEKFIEFFGGMFWVLFIVWFVRSFLWEPFQIPSGSMEPTLQNGDFILTSKFAYGVRLPVTHQKILSIGEIKRGDIVVFRFPLDPKKNFIKRVVGLPGDTLRIEDGKIWVNNEQQPLIALNNMHPGHDRRLDSKGRLIIYEEFEEVLSGVRHRVQFAKAHYPPPISGKVIVPEGNYFVMGDNRDDSEDSRFWGFVPEENLIGRALFIWMNRDCITFKGFCDRIGQRIQ